MRIGEFFGKYGTIKNVSVSYMGDNSKALVEFSTPQEAKTAVFDQEYVMGDKAIGKIWNVREAVVWEWFIGVCRMRRNGHRCRSGWDFAVRVWKG